MVFPKAPVNVVPEGISAAEMAAQRIGRERKPLGPPAKPGNCAAYDIFTAILEGRPYPVKALINFGSNTIMSTGDSQRAREAFRAVDFAVATELFMTLRPSFVIMSCRRRAFSRWKTWLWGLSTERRANCICNIAPPWLRRWRNGVPIPGLSSSSPNVWVWDRIFGKAHRGRLRARA